MPADNQSAMTENDRIEPTLNPSDGTPANASPEEREAAQAANEAELLDQLQADLAAMQGKNSELAEQFLRAQADIQNTRRRSRFARVPKQPCASSRARWSATRWSRSIRPSARSSTLISSRRSPSCPCPPIPRRNPTPWSAFCKKAT